MSEWSWIKNSWSDCSIWLNEKRVAVLSIYDEATEESQDELEAEMDERAARITACMNALEGLADLALLGGWTYKGMNAHALKIEQENATLQARVAELESQLPEGMKHCTIQFRECEKGHGWLTASNWVQHECATCERDELRRQNDDLILKQFDHIGSGNKAVRRIKAAAVREAHDWPVFFSQNSAGYDDNSYSAGFDDAMTISFARIKEIAAQMEAGKKIAGIMENNDSGIEFKANQIEGGA